MKKVLCLLMAICMVGGMLAACGNNQKDIANSSQTESENGQPVVENNTPAETYLADKVVNMMNLTVLYRNEEGLITSFDHGYEKEFICDYDENGNLVKISKFGYNDHGGVRTYYEMPDEVWNFTYDAEGNLVEYVHEGSDPWSYQYDENGRLTTIRLYPDSNVEVQYTYDDQGRVAAKKTRNTNNFEEEHIFEYDIEGNLAQYHEINYAHGDISYEAYYTYSYDSGAVVSCGRKIISAGGTNEQTVTFKYDDHGNLIEQELDGMTKMYEIQYVPMTLTAEQAAHAMENTEFILTFTNHRIMPNAIHVEWLR